jgi:hypothetical protein
MKVFKKINSLLKMILEKDGLHKTISLIRKKSNYLFPRVLIPNGDLEFNQKSIFGTVIFLQKDCNGQIPSLFGWIPI